MLILEGATEPYIASSIASGVRWKMIEVYPLGEAKEDSQPVLVIPVRRENLADMKRRILEAVAPSK